MDVGINQAWLAPPSGVLQGANYGHDFIEYNTEPNRRIFTNSEEFQANFQESVQETFSLARQCSFKVIGFWAFEGSIDSNGNYHLEGVTRDSTYRLSENMRTNCLEIMKQAVKDNIKIKWTLLAPKDGQRNNISRIITDAHSREQFYRNCVIPFLNTITSTITVSRENQLTNRSEIVNVNLGDYIYYVDLMNEANLCEEDYNLFTKSQLREWIEYVASNIFRNYRLKMAVSIMGRGDSVLDIFGRNNVIDWMTWLNQKRYIYYLDIHKYNDEGLVPVISELINEGTVRKGVILGEFGQTDRRINDELQVRVIRNFLNDALSKGYYAAIGWRLITHNDQNDRKHGYFSFIEPMIERQPPTMNDSAGARQRQEVEEARRRHRPRLSVTAIREWIQRNR